MGHTPIALAVLGFPIWLRAAHWINFILMGIVMRSGVQILGGYPRLYWNDNCRPGAEWIKFTKKPIPTDRPWITLDQEVSVSPLLGQPGKDNLGLGRHWHFFSVFFWVLNGLIYVVLLFTSGEWERLIPTSWSIFPDAWHTFVTYITFHLPPASAFHPYDPLQQLAYAGVVFLLGPFMILSGAAQSPAIDAQFPWFVKLFGGRQTARSLHFLGLIAFVAFVVIHLVMIIVTGFAKNMASMVLGSDTANHTLAVVLGLGIIFLGFLVWGVTTWYSLRQPRRTQVALGAFLHPFLQLATIRARSVQEYPAKAISPLFLVNGKPPESREYKNMLATNFREYQLAITGLVKHPLTLSMPALLAMLSRDQITKHQCIQGWSGIAEWRGIPLQYVLDRCEPLANAKYLVFRSYSQDTAGKEFYETLPIEVARQPQTILAYEMNGEPLPLQHGAPLRLRVETQLGFKMVKWLKSIEVVEEYHSIRDGQGGSREDELYYEQAAAI